jgi:hypothetical protein
MCNNIAAHGRTLLLMDRVARSDIWVSLFFKAGSPARDHLFFRVSSISIYRFIYFVIHPVFILCRTKVFDKASFAVYLKALCRAFHLHQRSSLRNEADPVGLLWVPVKYLKLAQRNRKHF